MKNMYEVIWIKETLKQVNVRVKNVEDKLLECLICKETWVAWDKSDGWWICPNKCNNSDELDEDYKNQGSLDGWVGINTTDLFEGLEYSGKSLSRASLRKIDYEQRVLECHLCGNQWQITPTLDWWVCPIGCNYYGGMTKDFQSVAKEFSIKKTNDSSDVLECLICGGQWKMKKTGDWWKCPFSHEEEYIYITNH